MILGGDVDRFGGLVHFVLAAWALGLGFVRQNNPRHAYGAVVAILTAQVRRWGLWLVMPGGGGVWLG